MIKKNRWQLMISSVIILLPIVTGVLLWNSLPEQMVTHWNIDGEPDGWSNKIFAIFGLPCIILALHWLCIIFTARDPKNKNQSNKVFNMILWILPMISLVVCGFTYAYALGNDINISMMVRILLGVLFVVIGNYMPKCKQNRAIGIRVTWTLQNEENWNRTHRFGGRLWVIGGVILLASMFVPVEKFLYVVIPLIVILTFAPIVYSYAYYKKLKVTDK